MEVRTGETRSGDDPPFDSSVPFDDALYGFIMDAPLTRGTMRVLLAALKLIDEGRDAGLADADGYVPVERAVLAEAARLSYTSVTKPLDTLIKQCALLERKLETQKEHVTQNWSSVSKLRYNDSWSDVLVDAASRTQEITDGYCVGSDATGLSPSTLVSPKSIITHSNQLDWREGEGKGGIHLCNPDSDAASFLTDCSSPRLDAITDPADALVCLAGDGKGYIVMIAAGNDKYVTRKGRFGRKQAERHLSGEECLGAGLGYGDGTTYALCWDADNAEDWKLLLEAADLLWQSGAYPLLEQSPSTLHAGGGHLWLVFDRPVHTADAFATATATAPGLRHVGERWPGSSKVRLPGGYYQRNEAQGWCSLWAR